MSEVYYRTCTTCGHKINDHDANECWNYEAHGENYATAKADAERGIAKIKAEAWDEGQEAGWNEAEECWAVEGMVGDFHKHSNVPNPHRIENGDGQ